MQPRLLLLALCLACTTGIATAQSAPSVDRNTDQTLAAAEAAINVGDVRQAESLLNRLSLGALGLPQIARVQIVRSEIALKRGEPVAALQALPSGSDHVPLYADQIEELRATALFQLHDPVAGTRVLVQRERYLAGSNQALADNREALWRSLLRSPAVPANDSRLVIQDSVTRGWVELAAQAQQGPQANYAQWRARYPQHPAFSRALALEAAANKAAATQGATVATAPGRAYMESPSNSRATYNGADSPAAANPAPQVAAAATAQATATAQAGAPQSAAPSYAPPAAGPGNGIALLVPLTGPFAATGAAVREGFLNAAQQSASGVRIYDSGATAAQALSAYQSAVSQGARVIVGPLQKDAVTALARLGTPAAPVIALNTLDAGITSPGNLLQFGLAPEDEARAAAEQAVAQGQQRAVMLVPRSEWGQRVSAAFSGRLRELGASVIASESFDTGTVDPSKIVSRLMGMDASQSRHKALTTVLGKETEFDPRRRGDVDFIFLAAKPADGRVILPQLRFFRASGLPLYTTSLLYEGRAVDWNPAKVCDMPWMLDVQGGWSAARDYAASKFPEPMRAYPRLVGLGTDAWRLAALLYNNQLRGDTVINGASGRLRLDADGRIRRDLSCSTPPVLAAVQSAASATP